MKVKGTWVKGVGGGRGLGVWVNEVGFKDGKGMWMRGSG